ncbi:hypothetical protein BWQ96_06256 [Gracilariopsis chorda]|uniref:Uncharacterized protein n=1 Tax=Gracilariopsis chorda TaxID=448386 RepID=A0A2V3IPN8_9FLOR|nr:hypothetical protein BWQ96_06256 [Gracilariopsis chorda]|eukprot:PXF44023.1 hypothetical protein BWQ96_06256 [Gracilariopsis chorda]
MAAHVRHLLTDVSSPTELLSSPVKCITLSLETMREQTNRYDIFAILDEASRRQVSGIILSSSESRHKSVMVRRHFKSVCMHLAGLWAHFRNENYRSLSDYSRQGKAVLRTWRTTCLLNPEGFLKACSKTTSVVTDLPISVLIALFVHSIRFKLEESEPDVARTVALLQDVLCPWTDAMSTAVQLFVDWEAILPANYVYVPEVLERVNHAWNNEVGSAGLQVPDDDGDAVYEDFVSWVSTASKFFQGPLPVSIRETARGYFHCRLLAVDEDENGTDAEIRAYICYRSKD